MKPNRTAAREALLDSLERETRRASGLGVMFSETVARRLGLTPTDLECLDIVMLEGSVTAGDLARASGLTTGAITGVIDRLEAAGFARRDRDPEDRRRVHVRANADAVAAGMPHYRALATAVGEMLDAYGDDEIAFLIDYFRRAQSVLAEQLKALRDDGTDKRLRSPRRGAAAAARRPRPPPGR